MENPEFHEGMDGFPENGMNMLSDRFFVKVEDYYERIDYADILWLKADEDSCVFFLTGNRSMYVNHYLGRVGQFLSDRPEFVRINRSEIINVRHVTRFIGNMYFIDRQELVATGIYRERMHGIFRLLEHRK